MKFIFTFIAVVVVTVQAFGQKKILDHKVYNDWKNLRSTILSDDGQFASYEIAPHQGDGYLYLYDIKNAVLDSFPRGEKAAFSKTSEFFTFRVSAGFDTLRTCELKKVDKKKWPKDSLFVLRLADKDIKSFPLLKKLDLANNSNWIAYSIDSTFAKPTSDAQKKNNFFAKFGKLFKKKKSKQPEKKVSSKGQIMYLYQPTTEHKVQVNDVTDFTFSDNGEFLIFEQHQKIDKEEKYSLSVYEIAKTEFITLDTARTKFSNFKTSKNDRYLAYLASSDTAKVKNSTFYLYDLRKRASVIALDSTHASVGVGKTITEHQTFVFTDNEKYLFLGVDDIKQVEPEDTLLTTEKAKLDVWHYQDKRNQPMQLLELKKDENASDLHVLRLDNFSLVPVGNDTLQVRIKRALEGNYVMATSDEAYSRKSNWDFPFAQDYYRIFLRDGSKELMGRKVKLGGDISPSGRYFTYFNEADLQFYVTDLNTNSSTCITCATKNVNWQQDGNGTPHVQFPLGVIGWERGEKEMWIQSEFDIWKYNLSDRKLVSITHEEGKENNIEFRSRIWERDSNYLSFNNVYLLGTDLTTKDEMIYTWQDHTDHIDLIQQYHTPHAINTVQKSKDGSRILLRKSNVTDYADAFILDREFKDEKRISHTNPQQKDYNWASVELMNYTSYDGQKLSALLYKPENFDATKKYPLLVYFYEMYTDRIHSHYAPKPTASIIFPTEYASAGYVVLIPDIRYRPGHPAKSAYDCIMASTDEALRKYSNLDSTRMGLQGQSWGGYQTAQLITMTTRYRAAMAGAPVANMFSAYGGMRWGSGMNRQFQYERTQSRIGKTIWEAPALYVENSPLFHLPNVRTPLLIMHNDEDGAVPWYQGIELFMGMKRLGKPCWLLNYNGDDHNLMKNANRVDLSIRMRQFFDHYLLEAPAPRWLIEGVPAVEKGKDYRLDLMEK